MSYLYDLVIYPLERVIELIYVWADSLFGNQGLNIVMVSLLVNLLILPLYKKSDAMQEQEREKQKSMEHWVSHIKKAFKGDERFLILSTYYRQQNYKPIYALKGSFSLLLQIPFFIAAYHFLSNLSPLIGADFLMIRDLSKPDGLIRLGSLSINLLPLLMTFFNILSGVIYTRGFSLKEKLQLYGMAAIFLVLLYDCPAGLVLYWMLNNLFSLIKNIFMKLVKLPQLPRLGKAEDKPTDGLLFVLSGLFLTVFSGAVVPLAAISSSPSDFLGGMTPTELVLHNVCIFAGITLLWFSIFYSLCGNRGKRGFTALSLALALSAVANFMLFGKNYGVMSSIFVYSAEPEFLKDEIIKSLIITLLLVGAAVFLALKKPAWGRKLMPVLLCGAIALTVVNASSTHKEMQKINAEQPEASEKEQDTAAPAPLIELSREGKNVVVLMLDRAFSGFVPYMLEERPELKEAFSGFTYYPNTTSFASHTVFVAASLFGGYEYTPYTMNERKGTIPNLYNEGIMVMPALFSGEGYRTSAFDIPYAGFSDFSKMSEFDPYTEGRSYSIIGNYVDESAAELKETSLDQQKQNLFYYSIFKGAPVILHDFIYNDGKYCSTGFVSVDVSFLRNYTTLKALPELTAVTDKAEDTFMMMQNEATHCNTLLDPSSYEPSVRATYGARRKTDGEGHEIDLKTEVQVSHYHVNMAALLTLGDWFDYLKEQGVYDNTRIIIASDHGYRYMYLFRDYDFLDGELQTEAFWSLLLAKDFGAEGELRTDDRFMTIADVPSLAAADIIEDAANPFTGEALDSHQKSELQYITTSGQYGLGVHRKNTFDTSDGAWYTVHDNIFDAANWKAAE